jgi:hypothetical protein
MSDCIARLLSCESSGFVSSSLLMNELLANVIWPFHGALWAQLIPVFLLIEAFVLLRYFPEQRKWALLGVLIANLVSSLLGMILVIPFQGFSSGSLSQVAAEEYWACIVAFLITVPVEYFVIVISRKFEDRKQLFRATFWMNFITYSICIAVVTYHWRWGGNSDWDGSIRSQFPKGELIGLACGLIV